MAHKVREVMSEQPVSVPSDAPIKEAARRMRQSNIGDILVTDNGGVLGIVTDRDIVVRAVATDRDLEHTKISEICSRDLALLSADSSIVDAVRLMKERAVRRLPVVENGKPIGFVSIGDLAMAQDPNSALAQISSKKPNL